MDYLHLQEEINRRVPETRIVQVDYEPDFYGAVDLIAALCRRQAVRPYVPLSWLHGWIYKPLEDIRDILFWGQETSVNLVHTEAQKKFCLEKGFRLTEAIGAPFLYVPQSGFKRLPNSILVMPPHTTRSTFQTFRETDYLDAIHEELSMFDNVVFCIHPHDLERNAWVENIRKIGYGLVRGATVEDQNALIRMRAIFDSFERVTSNSIGSHIPYAAYCGCKVSVFGPAPEISIDSFRDDLWSQQNWPIVERNVAWQMSGEARQIYSNIYCLPSNSQVQVEWAANELGAPCLRSPESVLELFGCSSDAADTVVVDSQERPEVSSQRNGLFKRLKNLFSGLKSQ